jgi:cytidine deaminase
MAKVMDQDQARQLMDIAKAAAQKAYAPYSHFPVGAALQTRSGEIISGVNVENVSYGLTICAERAAVATAISQGHQQFEALAVWATEMPNGAVTPCGACRQVLAEFMKANAIVLMADAQTADQIRQVTMASLLPEAFALDRDENSPRTDSNKLSG